MAVAELHAWDLTPDAARRLQAELRERLVLAWSPERDVDLVGGVDVAVPAGAEAMRAAIVVLRFPSLQPVEASVAEVPLTFPYVPGLLSFREGPAILRAWAGLSALPDVVLFDGQGIAHPRGLGLASHLGLWLQRPTVGVAKSRLFGQHAEPGPARGDQAELLGPGHPPRVIGAVVRTRPGTNPLYVSPGHLCDVPAAVRLVLACLTRYRLPAPTRLAHQVAGGAALPAM